MILLSTLMALVQDKPASDRQEGGRTMGSFLPEIFRFAVVVIVTVVIMLTCVLVALLLGGQGAILLGFAMILVGTLGALITLVRSKKEEQ